jgi:TorA maturation chaperone TorD
LDALEARHERLSEEELLRADVYGFLGRTLFLRPGEGELAALAGLTGDNTPFGRAFTDLATRAAASDPATAGDEYDTLFIGLGRGELVPYGSYYLTGFLHEKPLARLRAAMRNLGIDRAPEVKEPEDHLGVLMEMMAGLITGRYGAPASFDAQRGFFGDHIAPWAGHFFADLERAAASNLYAPVGRIGTLFMEIERAGFAME